MAHQNIRAEALAAQHVELKAGFWAERHITNRQKTIPAIYHQLKLTGRIDAWDLNIKRERPKRFAIIHMFFDSDSGKWLEAIGHSLLTHPDPELEALADDLIDRIEQAQQPDGYLNSYFTGVEPENRWRNLRDWHEMYNAGHLVEGAVAYYQATGKRKLLDVLIRYVDHIISLFGPNEGQKRGYPGHPEFEMALVRLYRATGEQRFLDLATYFIDERGQQPSYFDQEALARGEDLADFWAKTYHYCQAHAPIRDQETATGHAVRACYLYAGVADVALETGDPSLLETSRRLWDDLTQHQMYITGGLGPARSNEGFTFAYDLPNETAYAETCASIALAFWAHRMFHLDPNGRYIDVMERALYNGVMSGVSLDGTHYFYANPLAAYPNVNPHDPLSAVSPERHYRREEWFMCPCCPPNLARLVASIGGYFYAATPDTLYVHLYNASTARVSLAESTVQVEQHTNYPWDGDIRLTFQANQPAEFDLALRIPGWCRDFRLAVNGTPVSEEPKAGYVHIKRTWSSGDEVTLSLAIPVERIAPHPLIRQNAGCVALQRGPVVYCLEEVDNGPRLANLTLPRDAQLTAELDEGLFNGVVVITGQAVRKEPKDWLDDLYQPQSIVEYSHTPQPFKAIPYCFWANREPGEMRVWIHES